MTVVPIQVQRNYWGKRQNHLDWDKGVTFIPMGDRMTDRGWEEGQPGLRKHSYQNAVGTVLCLKAGGESGLIDQRFV